MFTPKVEKEEEAKVCVDLDIIIISANASMMANGSLFIVETLSNRSTESPNLFFALVHLLLQVFQL